MDIVQRLNSHVSFALALALIAVLAACTGTSKPSRYYILEAEPPAAVTTNAKTGGKDILIGIESVRIPGYIDKPQIVVTSTGSEIALNEFDRWGQPLERNIARVVALNVSSALKTERTILLDERRRSELDYIVEVDVVRFDLARNGESVLVARWTVLDGRREKELSNGLSTFSTPVAETGSEPNYEVLISTMGLNLSKLSGEIAKGIAALESSN